MAFRIALKGLVDVTVGGVSESEAQSFIETCMRDLVTEFADDDAVAQLVCDALHNRHVRDEAFFRWATAETAGRVRRTMALDRVRALQAETEGRSRVCRACWTSTRPDALKCLGCGAWL